MSVATWWAKGKRCIFPTKSSNGYIRNSSGDPPPPQVYGILLTRTLGRDGDIYR